MIERLSVECCEVSIDHHPVEQRTPGKSRAEFVVGCGALGSPRAQANHLPRAHRGTQSIRSSCVGGPGDRQIVWARGVRQHASAVG